MSVEEIKQKYGISNSVDLMRHLGIEFDGSNYKVNGRTYDDYEEAVVAADSGQDVIRADKKNHLPKVTASHYADYGTARFVASFLAFVGWLCVVISLLWALVTFSEVPRYGSGEKYMALLPSLILFIAGIVQVAGSQMMRAVVDTATYTRNILENIERRL